METDEITVEQAATILGVSGRHVRWYHKNNHLPGRLAFGRLLVFKRKDVEKLVANKPKKTGRPPKAEPAPEPSKPATKAKRKKKGGA